MRVKMNQPVNWGYKIATPREMLDTGEAKVVKLTNFAATGRSAPRHATFVETADGMCVEVSGYVTA